MCQGGRDLGSGAALAALAGQFGQLAMSLADRADRPLVQQRLVEFAVRGVPGAEYASLTQVTGKQPPRTTAQSCELPYRWDQLQYEFGEGPRLGGDRDERGDPGAGPARGGPVAGVRPGDRGADPARSMLSFRLFLTEDDRAALNLYATRAGAFTDESTATGSMFAAYSSMALLAAARNDQTNHLIRALETNREIGVAMGIMMAGGKLTRRERSTSCGRRARI